MWVGNRCYPPNDVQQALEGLFGEPVGHIKVIQYSIYVRFHWRAIATTRRNRIYLRGSGKEFFADGPLVLHEYFHVIRQWAHGRSHHPALSRRVFPPRLLGQSLRGRGARIHLDRKSIRYRALLAQHRTRDVAAGRARDPRRAEVRRAAVSPAGLRGGTAVPRAT